MKFIKTILLFLSVAGPIHAQTLFVDANKGKDNNRGTKDNPIKTLDRAVKIANSYDGQQPVKIVLFPGLYTLTHYLEIKTAQLSNDNVPYHIEALHMPDETGWTPAKMPIIQSIADNNMSDQFSHAVGLLILKNNVLIKGIKFLGDAHPNVEYYYAIRRQNKTLKGLTVSQCYFIGEKNSAPIQSAFWVNGPDIKVDHTIFYNCRNAFVLGGDINGFSLTYSIISGSYEAALWYRAKGLPFTFSHNIITNCNFLMVHERNNQPAYTFKDSYIVGNNHYIGDYPPAQDHYDPVKITRIKEVNVHKSGVIELQQPMLEGLPHDDLNLSSESAGKESLAGLFINVYKKRQE